jgi:hypothetical protein
MTSGSSMAVLVSTGDTLIAMTEGALRVVVLSHLSTPKRHAKGLVVVRSSSLGSVHIDCEDDHRYQFSGQFGCLADQEKDCCRWWQIGSFHVKTPRSTEGQTPGFGGWEALMPVIDLLC